MKIVVTGGSGIIGSYVVRELASASSHKVVVFDRARPSAEGVQWVRGDVEDLGDVTSVLVGADAVIHLAAFPIPYREVPNHVLFRTNMVGTYNVHEAALCLGVKRVVSTSSTGVLGWPYNTQDFPPHYLPIDEEHPLAPQDPYGISKICGEHLARGFTLKCDMETVVIRPGRVLLPEVSAQIRKRGGVRLSRFQHLAYIDVRDLATAYRQAVEVPNLRHEVMFVVADDTLAGEPLCELFPRLMPSLGEMARSLTGTRSALTNQKAKQKLQWQPRYSWRNPE